MTARWKFWSTNKPAAKSKRNEFRSTLQIETLEDRVVMSADPVLMVIANQDFWYDDYANTRDAIEAAGVEVAVAAKTTNLAVPHSWNGSPQQAVQPDLALSDVEAEDYSAIAFIGGWGASSYQYGFEGTYHNNAYNGHTSTKTVVNDLINDFVAQDKYVAAICYGVSVLAWARVDGESLLEGRTVAGWHGAAPGANVGNGTAPWHYTTNGATLLDSGSIGDPTTSADDVIVDGNIITAENWYAGAAFGDTIATHVIAASGSEEETEPEGEGETATQPVLMVIANQDFYYREYSETRQALEEGGMSVVVGATNVAWSTPHWNSGQGEDGGFVMPDIALTDVDAADYSAIVFVGGWGSAQYQYGFEGTYNNNAYNGDAATKQTVNDMINDFVVQDKYVAALCHGVTVLAYARIDGVSLLDGATVSAWAGDSPSQVTGGWDNSTRTHIEGNGAVMVASGSVGDPTTVEDDVIVDGKIITGENYDSAYYFGQVIAQQLQS